MDFMQNHPLYAPIGAGIIIVSHLIWRAIKFGSQKEKERRVNELVLFCDASKNCSPLHLRNIQSESKGMEKCDNRYCTIKGMGKLAHQIDQAVYAIDAAIFQFTSLTLCAAFKRALQRGVSIRIISDREMVLSSGSQLRVLTDLGVALRGPVTTAMMHHKFLVIDGAERLKEIRRLKQLKQMRPSCSVLISGSANWTRSGFGGNSDNCIITADKVMADAFQTEFSRMWKAFEKYPDITKEQPKSDKK